MQQFRSIAKTYRKLCIREAELTQEIEAEQYRLEGVRGLDPAREPSGKGCADNTRFYELMEYRDSKIQERETVRQQLQWIRSVVMDCEVDERPYVWLVLLCQVPVGKAAKMLDIPWETLSRKISSALEKVVTEERLEQFDRMSD